MNLENVKIGDVLVYTKYSFKELCTVTEVHKNFVKTDSNFAFSIHTSCQRPKQTTAFRTNVYASVATQADIDGVTLRKRIVKANNDLARVSVTKITIDLAEKFLADLEKLK
jgi:hypothetical protein